MLAAFNTSPRGSENDAVIALMNHGAALEKSLQVGRLLLERYFGGDPTRWRDRKGREHRSIRRLAASPGFAMGRTAIHESVAIYVLSLDLPQVVQLPNLRASHLGAVARLPRSNALELLTLASEKQWTVRKLRASAANIRRESGERRGRPPTLPRPVVNTTSALSRALGALESSLMQEPQLAAQIPKLQELADEMLRLVEQRRKEQRRG